MKEQEETSESSLSEEERIELLEQEEKSDRIWLWVVSVVGGLALLIWLVMTLISSLSDESDVLSVDNVQAMEQRVVKLEKSVERLERLVAMQDEQLATLKANQFTGLHTTVDDKGTIGRVAQVLQAQEKDYQQVMDGLKGGMRDLANMLPGSRSWLSDYSEAIDQAQASSRKRASELQKWALESQNPLPSTPTPLIPATPAATGKP